MEQNLCYSELLMKDYSGISSEYTAISQYVYYNMVTDNKKIANDFMKAGRDEMTHLHLLGDTIIKLGGNPIFINEYGEYWNSSFVPYGCNIADRLQLAIKGELDAIYQYELHAAMIQDPYIQKLLQKIIADEKRHANMFQEDLASLC